MCKKPVKTLALLALVALVAASSAWSQIVIPASESTRTQMSAPDDNVSANRLVVRTEVGDPSRSLKCWLKFDLAGIDVNKVEAASLVLTLWKDRGPCGFDVSAVNDDVVDNIDWQTTTLTWNNAPGNDPASEGALDPNKTTLLGRAETQTGLAGDKLIVDALDAIRADTDGTVQFVMHNASAYIQVAHHADPCEAWRPVLVLDKAEAGLVTKAAAMAGYDQAIIDRLDSMGYEVTVIDSQDVKNGVFTVEQAEALDVIVISEVISSSDANPLAGANVPIMSCEGYGWHKMNYAESDGSASWQLVNDPNGNPVMIVDDRHPIVIDANLTAGPIPFLMNDGAAATTASVASLAPGAVNIASIVVGETEYALIFAIDKGAELAKGAGPAANRIVGFSLPGNQDPNLSDAGWALFDAAIRWLDPAPLPLVSYWPMDEGTGTVVADLVGGNDGTLLDGASWATGVMFDANEPNAAIVVPNSPDFDFGNVDYTVSMLVRYPVAPVGEAALFCKGTIPYVEGVSTGKRYVIFDKNGAMRFEIDDNVKKSGLSVSDASFVTGEWVNLVAVHDSVAGTLSLYADGVLLGTQDASATGDISNGEDLYIGNYPGGGKPAQCEIAGVQIFSKALSPAEIADLAM